MKAIEDICIIDDDAIAVFGLKRSFDSIGFSNDISVFENGLDAFENFEQQIEDESSLPSVLFIDLNMPVMDGWDFLEEFTRIYPEDKKLPTIFIMTSSIDAKDVEKAKAYDLECNYLVKPVTAEVLQSILT